MHCNGQCVLMRKLKEQEHKDQQAPERKGENKSELISSGFFYTSPDLLAVINAPLVFFSYQETTLLRHSRSIFHPPNA